MAIIYTYPTKATLADSDLILISDSADVNKTKNATVTSIKDAINVVDSLTATLPLLSSSATGSPDLSISGVSGYGTAGQVMRMNAGATALEWATVSGGSGDGLTIYDDGSGVGLNITKLDFIGSGVSAAVDGTISDKVNVTIAGGGGNPGGTANNQVQYKNGTAFAATDLFTYSSRILSIGKINDTARSHFKVYGGGSDDAYITLYCSAGTHGVTIEGPDHTGGTPASYTLKLPNSLPSVANQILESNQTGTLSWIATPTSGGGAPGGSSTQFQYNNGTTFAGTDSLRFDADKIHMGRSTSPITRGQLVMYGDGTNASDIQLYNGGNNRFLKIAQQAGATQDLTLTFPGVAPGGNNKILESDSTGQLSWIATPTGSGGISFSGATVSGIATFASTSSATVNSEVKLAASGQMTFDGSSGNTGIKFDSGSSTLRVGDIVGNSDIVALYSDGAPKITVSDSDVLVADTTQFQQGLKFLVGGSILDKYQEGTWTPTAFVGTGTPPTVTSAVGTYVRIGNTVHITFEIVVTGSSSASVPMIVGGLPVNAVNLTGYRSAGILYANTDGNTPATYVSNFYAAGAQLYMQVVGGNKDPLVTPYGLKIADVASSWYRPSGGTGATLKGSCTYRVA